ncbi:MAG: tetratricopeptide repeat protein [Candidatus Obscuribacterales bacterium]|nr:tetratricopeptide repeat protein [Candidatus Obscuribacterales bacterium]
MPKTIVIRVLSARVFLWLSLSLLLPLSLTACSKDAAEKTEDLDSLISSGKKVEAEKLIEKRLAALSEAEKLQQLCRLADLKSTDPEGVSESLLKTIATLSSKLYGLSSKEYAEANKRLGQYYFRKREFQNSVDAWSKAGNFYEQSGDNCGEMEALSGRIAGECASGKCTQQAELYEKLLKLREACLGKNNPQTVIACSLLAEIYSRQKRFSDSLPLFQRVYDSSKSEEERAAASINLGRNYLELREFDKAKSLIDTALKYAEANPVYGRINPLLIAALKAKLYYFDQKKMYKDELSVAEKIMKLNEAQMGPAHPQLAGTLLIYAEALERAGKKKESETVFLRIKALEAKKD